MKRFLAILAAVLAALMCAGASAATLPKPSELVYVYDETGVLSDDTKGVILFTNDLLKKECGAEIAVVAVKTTGREEIGDYALELLNSWGIGDKKKQNGVLLLLAIDDDDYYALPGTGLDLELSGGTLDSLLREYLEPDFAEKRYDEGVLLFFTHLVEIVSDIHGVSVTAADGRAAFEEYQEKNGNTAKLPVTSPERTATNGGRENESESSGSALLGLVIIAVVVIVVVAVVRRRTARAPRGGTTVVIPSAPAPSRPRVIVRRTSDPWRSYSQGPIGPVGPSPRNGPVRPSVSTRSSGTAARTSGSSYSRPSAGSFWGGSSFGSSRSSSGSGRSSSSSRSVSFGGGRSFGGGGSRGGGAGRGKR